MSSSSGPYAYDCTGAFGVTVEIRILIEINTVSGSQNNLFRGILTCSQKIWLGSDAVISNLFAQELLYHSALNIALPVLLFGLLILHSPLTGFLEQHLLVETI